MQDKRTAFEKYKQDKASMLQSILFEEKRQ